MSHWSLVIGHWQLAVGSCASCFVLRASGSESGSGSGSGSRSGSESRSGQGSRFVRPIPAGGRIEIIDDRWWGSDDIDGSLWHLQSRRDGMV